MKYFHIAMAVFASVLLVNCTGKSIPESSDKIIVLEKESDFEKITSDSATVIVDFYADWCKPCKMQGPILEEIAAEMNGKIIILKVNVDKFPELANRFNVNGIPALVMFNKGDQIWDAVGLQDKTTIMSAYKMNI